MPDPLVADEAMGLAAITALRSAAHQWDWNACRSALDRALVGMSGKAMVAVAEAILRGELPRFECNHPGESWPRRALDGEVHDLGPEYDHPGGNSFASGVEDLLDARMSVDDPALCRRCVVSAISRIIMGAMDAVWAAKYPDRWRRWFDRTYLNRPCSEGHPRTGFMEDPDVRQIELALWNDVADRLAAAWEGSC